ncbi:MFS transporter [Streptomyces viridochromogenes]|uniref:MFS transporter n=1 Tax=Streptomyces viridochromogenes TaxID=1938 RepID=A0A0J7ZJL2_STRVR|nr:MFS transporter [Streptomyces viridochromogenes]KMS76211.1 MFS transporter [Streptomyces viridochromogenes]KOG25039.1 MFS transporter [Streptomyces viridochromogenes]KOG26506.1 MFS transporter [Streptomyces viridochromogenes]
MTEVARDLQDVESKTDGPSLWRQRDFLLLWSGQTVSEIGSAVTRVALPLVAVVALQASTFQVGLLTAATTLAFAVIALPAGAIVDRRPKRSIMIVCDLLRLLILGSIPVAGAFDVLTMTQLYLVAIAAGVCTVFFDVAYQSYLPSLVRTEDLMAANGKLGTTQAFAQLGGPSLGGGLVGLVGAAGAVVADALSYAVSMLAILGIRRREEPPPPPPADEPLRRRITEGLRFVFGHPILRRVVICTGAGNLFSGMTSALAMVFLIRVLHVSPALTGLIMAGSAIGAIAGGLFAGQLAKKVGSARIIWMSMLVFSAPQVIAAAAWQGWGVLLFPLGWGVTGFAFMVYNVAQVSYRQSVTPPELMGRMNAAVRWVVWGTLPLGSILGGALGTLIGVRPALMVAFIGSWAAGWFVFFSPLRHIRDIPQSTTD